MTVRSGQFHHRSQLQRWLGPGAGPGDSDDAGPDVAERLGAWLGVADAITLRTGLAQVAAAKPGPAPAGESDLEQALASTRATLTQMIKGLGVQATPKLPGHARVVRPVAVSEPPPLDPSTEFSLLLQEYGDVQRRMELRVDALRSHARQVLAAQSVRLAQLAAMDALMAQLVHAREQNLLANIPSLLRRRFEARRQAATTGDEAQHDAADASWFKALRADFQQALLAELDLRLQPIAGLAQAQVEAQPLG